MIGKMQTTPATKERPYKAQRLLEALKQTESGRRTIWEVYKTFKKIPFIKTHDRKNWH